MWLDACIILAFVVYSISVGFLNERAASRGLEDYFLAGRKLKGWQAGMSMAATQYAADTPLLVAGLVATFGLFSLWRLWIYALAFLFLAFIFGPCWRKARVLTDAELTELRYSGRAAGVLRTLKALHFGTFINCTVLAMVLIAASRISEQFLFWHLWLPTAMIDPLMRLLEHWDFSLTTLSSSHPAFWLRSADNVISIGLIVLFTWLYSTTGGLRSVVTTDIVQFIIAMVATALYAAFIVVECGGFSQMGESLVKLYGEGTASTILSFGPSELGGDVLIFFGIIAIQWIAQVNADGTGYLAQRMMACASDAEARKAGLIFTFSQVFLRSILWLPIIIGLLVLYPATETPATGQTSEAFRLGREGTFALGIHDFLPAGIKGLMLTGLIGALASTIDTHLNWGASYWTNDLYKRLLMEKLFRREARKKELVWVARASNLGILAVALLIMRNLGSIQSAWNLSLLFGSGLGIVLVMRWLWYRINVWSEVAAGVASIILAPVLLVTFPEATQGERMLLMVLFSTLAVFIATLLTPQESQETLGKFYRRVRPPGYWKPVELYLGIDGEPSKRELGNGILAVAVSVFALFSLLIGVGQLITNQIFGDFTFWPLVLIALSVLVLPISVIYGRRATLTSS